MPRSVWVFALFLLLPSAASSADSRVAGLEASCKAGTAADCTKLARIFARGEGVPRSLERAATLFRQACNGRDGEACGELATLWSLGDGVVASDDAEAQRLWRRACDLGHELSCRTLAFAQVTQEGSETLSAEALALVSKACDGGYAEACLVLSGAHAVGEGGVAKDPARAQRLWKRALDLSSRACDAGSADACLGVAQMYKAPGSGLEASRRPADAANPARSLEYRRRAEALLQAGCDGGDLGRTGCVGLGSFHARAHGATFDFERALAPLEKACRAGYYEGCEELESLRSLYQGGNGTARDEAKLARIRAACVVREACGGPPTTPRGAPLGDEPGSSRVRDRLLKTALDKSVGSAERFEAAEGLAKMGYTEPVAAILEIQKVYESHDDMLLVHHQAETRETRMLQDGRKPTREEVESLAREALAAARRRNDAWGKPLRLTVQAKDSKYLPWGVDILSDGPDGRAGTDDDLSTAEPDWAYVKRRYPIW